MDSTNTNPAAPEADAPKPTTAQQIEAMVSRAGRTAPAPAFKTTESHGDGSLSINTATNELVVKGDVQRLTDDAVITDTNVHEQRTTFDKLGVEFKRVTDMLNERTFDPRTGQPVFTYTGDQRRVLELQAQQAYRGGEAVQATITRLQQQSAAAAELQAKRESEAAARSAFSQGDPRRAALYDEAIAKAEAEEAARIAIAARSK